MLQLHHALLRLWLSKVHHPVCNSTEGSEGGSPRCSLRASSQASPHCSDPNKVRERMITLLRRTGHMERPQPWRRHTTFQSSFSQKYSGAMHELDW